MTEEKLMGILQHNIQNLEPMERWIQSQYDFRGLPEAMDLRKMLQEARILLRKKDFLLIELPVKDYEIGAVCYRSDWNGFIVLNSNIPKVNERFALSHELYHVYSSEAYPALKTEPSRMNESVSDEEMNANLFAGLLLMPSSFFIRTFEQFSMEPDASLFHTVLRLMNYFEVPYMAVLIRCLELRLISLPDLLKESLLEKNADEIRRGLVRLWLDEKILEPRRNNESEQFLELLKEEGTEMVSCSFMRPEELEQYLQESRNLLQAITGEGLCA